MAKITKEEAQRVKVWIACTGYPWFDDMLDWQKSEIGVNVSDLICTLSNASEVRETAYKLARQKGFV